MTPVIRADGTVLEIPDQEEAMTTYEIIQPRT